MKAVSERSLCGVTVRYEEGALHIANLSPSAVL